MVPAGRAGTSQVALSADDSSDLSSARQRVERYYRSIAIGSSTALSLFNNDLPPLPTEKLIPALNRGTGGSGVIPVRAPTARVSTAQFAPPVTAALQPPGVGASAQHSAPSTDDVAASEAQVGSRPAGWPRPVSPSKPTSPVTYQAGALAGKPAWLPPGGSRHLGSAPSSPPPPAAAALRVRAWAPQQAAADQQDAAVAAALAYDPAITHHNARASFMKPVSVDDVQRLFEGHKALVLQAADRQLQLQQQERPRGGQEEWAEEAAQTMTAVSRQLERMKLEQKLKVEPKHFIGDSLVPGGAWKDAGPPPRKPLHEPKSIAAAAPTAPTAAGAGSASSRKRPLERARPAASPTTSPRKGSTAAAAPLPAAPSSQVLQGRGASCAGAPDAGTAVTRPPWSPPKPRPATKVASPGPSGLRPPAAPPPAQLHEQRDRLEAALSKLRQIKQEMEATAAGVLAAPGAPQPPPSGTGPAARAITGSGSPLAFSGKGSPAPVKVPTTSARGPAVDSPAGPLPPLHAAPLAAAQDGSRHGGDLDSLIATARNELEQSRVRAQLALASSDTRTLAGSGALGLGGASPLRGLRPLVPEMSEAAATAGSDTSTPSEEEVALQVAGRGSMQQVYKTNGQDTVNDMASSRNVQLLRKLEKAVEQLAALGKAVEDAGLEDEEDWGEIKKEEEEFEEEEEEEEPVAATGASAGGIGGVSAPVPVHVEQPEVSAGSSGEDSEELRQPLLQPVLDTYQRPAAVNAAGSSETTRGLPAGDSVDYVTTSLELDDELFSRYTDEHGHIGAEEFALLLEEQAQLMAEQMLRAGWSPLQEEGLVGGSSDEDAM